MKAQYDNDRLTSDSTWWRLDWNKWWYDDTIDWQGWKHKMIDWKMISAQYDDDRLTSDSTIYDDSLKSETVWWRWLKSESTDMMITIDWQVKGQYDRR